MIRLWQVAGLVVLLALGVEVGSQLIEWLRPEVEDVSFDYAPYRMLRMKSAPFELNREGFRAKELDTYRGKFLVEFLGGSVCLGVGTHPGKPVSEQLEEALHRAGLMQAAVVNLCQGGTASGQELAIFLQYGLPLHPQVVLSFNGANDLLHPRPLGEDPAANLPYHNREMQALFEGHHSWFEHLALKRVSDRIHRNWLSPAMEQRTGETGQVAPHSIFESYLYMTEVTRRLTEAQGGTYALLLQPSLHYAKTWSTEERTQWVGRRPHDAQAATEYAHSLYAQMRTATAVWAARSGGRLLDLTETFASTQGTVYSDSVHFTGETGFQLLEAEVERQGLIQLIEERYREWERSPNEHSSDSRSVAWLR